MNGDGRKTPRTGCRARWCRPHSWRSCCCSGFWPRQCWGVSRILLPNPVNVWHQLVDIVGSGEFIPDLRVTLGELAAAFAIAMSLGVTIGYLISRSRYWIKVFEPLALGDLCDPDHPVPAALCPAARPRPGVEDRAGRHHQLLSDCAQHHRRIRQRRSHAVDRGPLDGRKQYSDVSACAVAGGAAGYRSPDCAWVSPSRCYRS